MGGEEMPRRPLIARMGMGAADHQAIDALGRILRHAEPDPAAHRIAPEMRFREIERVEHGGDIGDPPIKAVRTRIVRLVALAVTAPVDQDQPIVGLERIDIAGPVPILDGLYQAVLEDEWLPLPLNAIMDTYTSVICKWHRVTPPSARTPALA